MGIKLDEYDLKILETIQKNGRITKTKLAEEINLSPSPTWERLKRLEDSGIITGYQANVDIKKVHPFTTVMVEVVLKRHQSEDFRCFEDAVSELPEVTECLATGGGIDYLMRVMTADIDAYQRFMDVLLERDIGIDRYFSYIITKPVKPYQGYPVTELTKNSSAKRA